MSMNTDKILEEIRSDVKALNARFDGVDARFGGIDSRFDKIDKTLETFESNMNEMMTTHSSKTDEQFLELETRLDKRIDSLETKMVTKSFLEDKLADFRAEGRRGRRPHGGVPRPRAA